MQKYNLQKMQLTNITVSSAWVKSAGC